MCIKTGEARNITEHLKSQFPGLLNEKRVSTTHKQIVTSFYNRLFNMRFQRFTKKKRGIYGKSFT